MAALEATFRVTSLFKVIRHCKTGVACEVRDWCLGFSKAESRLMASARAVSSPLSFCADVSDNSVCPVFSNTFNIELKPKSQSCSHSHSRLTSKGKPSCPSIVQFIILTDAVSPTSFPKTLKTSLSTTHSKCSAPHVVKSTPTGSPSTVMYGRFQLSTFLLLD